MKKFITTSILALLVAAGTALTAKDRPDEYLGLPGDNLNLYAVMKLFQESETLEAFERSLNDQENTINNLDLNGDNFVDYITVSDYVDDNVHNIVLRASLDRNEQQDIAVFVVEKLRNDAVQIQLIGDEALYGPNYIVEPIYAETPNPGYSGNAFVYNSTYYDIAAWPVVRYIYHPRYRVWRSAWYWGYYPSYWTSWSPHYWHYYYGYHSHWHNHYYSHYRQWDHYRCNSYNTYYRNHVRVYSPTVVVNINRGHYTKTYSRPNQLRAGEQYYAQTAGQRTASRRSSVSTQQSGSSQGRSNSSVSRSTGQRGTIAVSRSSSQRSNTSVQNKSSQGRSSASVSRSSGKRSTPSASRSNSSGSSDKKSDSRANKGSSTSRSRL